MGKRVIRGEAGESSARPGVMTGLPGSLTLSADVEDCRDFVVRFEISSGVQV